MIYFLIILPFIIALGVYFFTKAMSKPNAPDSLELDMLLPPLPTPSNEKAPSRYMKAEPGEKVFKYGSDNPSDHLDGSTHFSALTTTEFDNYDVG